MITSNKVINHIKSNILANINNVSDHEIVLNLLLIEKCMTENRFKIIAGGTTFGLATLASFIFATPLTPAICAVCGLAGFSEYLYDATSNEKLDKLNKTLLDIMLERCKGNILEAYFTVSMLIDRVDLDEFREYISKI